MKVKTGARMVLSLKRPFLLWPSGFAHTLSSCQQNGFEITWVVFGLKQSSAIPAVLSEMPCRWHSLGYVVVGDCYLNYRSYGTL
jgi:hypothetical protein